MYKKLKQIAEKIFNWATKYKYNLFIVISIIIYSMIIILIHLFTNLFTNLEFATLVSLSLGILSIFLTIWYSAIKNLRYKENVYNDVKKIIIHIVFGYDFEIYDKKKLLNILKIEDPIVKKRKLIELRRHFILQMFKKEMLITDNLYTLSEYLSTSYEFSDLNYKMKKLLDKKIRNKSEYLILFRKWFFKLEKKILKKFNWELMDIYKLIQEFEVINNFKIIYDGKINKDRFKNMIDAPVSQKIENAKKIFKYNQNIVFNDNNRELKFINLSIEKTWTFNSQEKWYGMQCFKKLLYFKEYEQDSNLFYTVKEFYEILIDVEYKREDTDIIETIFNLLIYFDKWDFMPITSYSYGNSMVDIFKKDDLLEIIELNKIKKWVFENWYKPLSSKLNYLEESRLKTRLTFCINLLWDKWDKFFLFIPQEYISKKSLINDSFGIKETFINIHMSITKWEKEDNDDSFSHGYCGSDNWWSKENFIKKLRTATFSFTESDEWFKILDDEITVLKESIWEEIENGENIHFNFDIDYEERFNSKKEFEIGWEKNITKKINLLKEKYNNTYKDPEVLDFIKTLK